MSKTPWRKHLKLTDKDTNVVWSNFLQHRVSAAFNWKEQVVLTFFSPCVQCCCRRRTSKLKQKSWVLGAAQDKLDRSLDVRRLVKVTREFKHALKAMFGHKALQLLKHQYSDVLRPQSVLLKSQYGTSSSSSEENGHAKARNFGQDLALNW